MPKRNYETMQLLSSVLIQILIFGFLNYISTRVGRFWNQALGPTDIPAPKYSKNFAKKILNGDRGCQKSTRTKKQKIFFLPLYRGFCILHEQELKIKKMCVESSVIFCRVPSPPLPPTNFSLFFLDCLTVSVCLCC